MLWALLQTLELIVFWNPTRNWIKQPNLCKVLTISECGLLIRLFSLTAGGRIKQSGVSGGSRCCSSVCTQPASKRFRPSHLVSCIGNITIDDSLNVGIQQCDLDERIHGSDGGESASGDEACVVVERTVRRTRYIGVSGQDPGEAACGVSDATFMHCHWSHSQ